MKKLNTRSALLFSCALGLVLGLNSCKKKNNLVGEEIKLASSNFSFLTEISASDTTWNFDSIPTIQFVSKFSEEVNYTLSIKGLSSGAEKVFTGVSDQLENAKWDGSSSNIHFFSSKEEVLAEVTIMGTTKTTSMIDSLDVAKGYHTYPVSDSTSLVTTINGIKHIVLDDLDQGTDSTNTYGDMGSFYVADAADEMVGFGFDSKVKVQGSSSFRMEGEDVNHNGWCGGMNSENLCDYYLVASTNELLIDSGLSEDDLYFNLFVYGTGKPSTSIQLKIFEWDLDSVQINADSVAYTRNREELRNALFESKGNPPKIVYDQSVNDGYIYNFGVEWTGWRLVSVPYSWFKPNQDPLTGGAGDRVKESWRICGMAISLLSDPSTGEHVETYVDYVTATVGGQFQR